MFGSQVIKLNDEEFYEITDIICKSTGLIYRKNKQYLLEYKLSPRLKELNFNAFRDYIYYLKYPAINKQEIQVLINLITINETYFFRERYHIDFMIKKAIPELAQTGKNKFKIWSAACSTGEEPYSIAILLKENSLTSKFNFEIIASDIDTDCLNKAKKGQYKLNSFRSDDSSLINKYFICNDSFYTLKNEISGIVKFYRLNLNDNSFISLVSNIDFLFCRNVLIYFDIDVKKKVIDQFYNVLNNGGFLFLGYAETLSRISDKFVLINFGEGSYYKKKDSSMG
jgi:chemotaxis protein methyltransferase CheR